MKLPKRSFLNYPASHSKLIIMLTYGSGAFNLLITGIELGIYPIHHA
jgi:hypothetical protein